MSMIFPTSGAHIGSRSMALSIIGITVTYYPNAN